MYWRLSDTVTACLASDRILFLDVGRDRYCSLAKELTGPFLAWLRSRDERLPQAAIAMLSEVGIDARSEMHRGFPAESRVSKPRATDSVELPRVRPSSIDLLSVGAAVAWAARDVRSRPLARLLQRRLSNRPSANAPTSNLKSRLAIFRAARPFVPVRRICLHDCLALLDWLRGDAAGVALVFGVSAYPFTAHCWLQSGSEVIDDHPESPSRFEPILHFE